MATLYYRPYTTDLNTDAAETPAIGRDRDTGHVPGNYPEYVLNEPVPPRHREPAVHAPSVPTASSVPLGDGDDDRYRVAVQRMGQDIISLRQRLHSLELENKSLRQNLHSDSDSNKILLDSVELDGLPKSELVGRYIGLKQRITSHEAELATYKAKVQHLQNELIRKNDREEDFIRMSKAHTKQQQLLHQLQDKVHKVKKVEAEVSRQEKLIARLEAELERSRGGAAVTGPVARGYPRAIRAAGQVQAEESLSQALVEENRRLREEIDKWKDNARSKEGQPAMDDTERLELYQQLDRAEGRIISLEKQLHETSGKWGREKEQMSRRLRESEHGLSSQF